MSMQVHRRWRWNAGLVERMILAAAVVCLSWHAGAQQRDAAIRLEVAGTVRLAADGAVMRFEPEPQVSAPVAAQVAKSVGGWRLAGKDGQTAEGETHVRMALEAVSLEQGYGLRLTEVWIGAPSLAPGTPLPEYPRVLLEARAGSRVLLQLGLDDEGSVAYATVKHMGLLTHIKDEAIRAKWRERFGQASVEAARHWKLVAGSRQGSRAVFPREVLVLVTFWPRDLKGDTDYRHIGWPMATSPWAIQNRTTLPPGSVLVDPRVLPVDSTLSLQEDVVGSML